MAEASNTPVERLQRRLAAAGKRGLGFRNLGWDLGVRLMEKAAGHRRGEPLDVRLATTTRDLLTEKSRAAREEVRALRLEMEALAHEVMSAGEYARSEEAVRAVRAVLTAFRRQLPPDLLLRLSEYLPEAEAREIRDWLRQAACRERAAGGAAH